MLKTFGLVSSSVAGMPFFRDPLGPRALAGRLCASLAGIVALLALGEYVIGRNMRIHRFFSADATGLRLTLLLVVLLAVLAVTIWQTSVTLATRMIELRRAHQDRDALLVREREAREQAERADRSKDDFIATISHELRTPLNAIVGWMRMLQQNALSESRRADAMAIVGRNAAILARLVEDLVDVSRMTNSHLEIAALPTDLNGVVQAAVEAITPSADAKRIRVITFMDPTEPLVLGDPHRLQQVVWNLLSNALKFSPDGGAVEIIVRGGSPNSEILVRDRGLGIEPAFLPYVFERFRQGAPSAGHPHSGLGLGLAIAKHLTERHGGSIRAWSNGPGHGATFTVVLPTDSPSLLHSRGLMMVHHPTTQQDEEVAQAQVPHTR